MSSRTLDFRGRTRAQVAEILGVELIRALWPSRRTAAEILRQNVQQVRQARGLPARKGNAA